MKTKIIYISGGEVFDMAEIRAAFDQVRGALGLGTDTIMFGVPVDADCALANTNMTDATEPVDTPIIESTENHDSTPIPEQISEIEPIIEAMPEPVKPARKSRARKAVAAEAEAEIAEIAENVSVENSAEPDVASTTEEAEKVIPILSILAANQDVPTDDASESVDAAEPVENATTITAATEEPIVAESITETVSVDEVEMTDEAPRAPVEKTLEQLLESMTPLREELHPTDTETQSPIMDDLPTFDDADSADATLEQLASEFAENQDKIVPTPRAENHGKIGKLKNILPFKKIKRDDNGLMGDLFGWAGIAANDDDFSMPGFFTSAASKK